MGLAKKMRQQLNELLQGGDVNSEAISLTPGQMLLMGFHGLFTRLDTDFTTMLDTVMKLDTPAVWRKVDVVKEARSLQVRALPV